MEKSNAIGFVLGAALGGALAYWAFKHQDEILNTINELENNLNVDKNSLVNQAKMQWDQLNRTIKAAITDSTDTQSPIATETSNELLNEIKQLRDELERLKASPNDVITSQHPH